MRIRLMILFGVTWLLVPSLHADWCIEASPAAAAHIGGSEKCGFATQADAQNWINQNLPNISGVWVKNNGSPATSSGNGGNGGGIGGAPFKSNGGLNSQQQMGVQIGTMAGNLLGNLFAQPQGGIATDSSQRQLQIQAQQLNNAGVQNMKWGKYDAAIEQFQKALLKTPGDQTIIDNLNRAMNHQKVGQTKNALADVLPPAPENQDSGGYSGGSGANQSSPALNQVNLDANTVDLRNAPQEYIDPAQLKNGNPSDNGQPIATNDKEKTLQEINQLLGSDGNQPANCSVTVKTDTSDPIGHTALQGSCPGQEYLNFSYGPGDSFLGPETSIFATSTYTHDNYTGLYTFPVAPSQYSQMLNRAQSTGAYYSLVGNNCTTTARAILNSGGISASDNNYIIDRPSVIDNQLKNGGFNNSSDGSAGK